MGNMVWVGIVYANYSPDSRCAGAFLICFIGSCGGVCRPSGLEVLRNAPQRIAYMGSTQSTELKIKHKP